MILYECSLLCEMADASQKYRKKRQEQQHQQRTYTYAQAQHTQREQENPLQYKFLRQFIIGDIKYNARAFTFYLRQFIFG